MTRIRTAALLSLLACFKASVKGNKKASDASGKSPVSPLELQAMKDWFNGARDSVRVVSLLSPTWLPMRVA